jgi:hypothetical protein
MTSRVQTVRADFAANNNISGGRIRIYRHLYGERGVIAMLDFPASPR